MFGILFPYYCHWKPPSVSTLMENFFCKAAFTKMLTLIGSDMRKLSERKMEPIARQLSLSVRVSRELGVNHKGTGEVSSEILVKRAMDETTDLWKTAPCFESEESLSSFLSLQARHWFLSEQGPCCRLGESCWCEGISIWLQDFMGSIQPRHEWAELLVTSARWDLTQCMA